MKHIGQYYETYCTIYFTILQKCIFYHAKKVFIYLGIEELTSPYYRETYFAIVQKIILRLTKNNILYYTTKENSSPHNRGRHSQAR